MAGYGNDEGLQAWLDSQGYTLPVGSPALAVLRQRGSDYLDAAYAHRLMCSAPTGGIEQERAWPRTGGLFPDNAIPSAWVNASYRAAYLEALNPGSLFLSYDPNKRVKRNKVDGAVEQEFFEGGSGSGAGGGGSFLDTLIDGLVGPYLCAVDDGFGLGLWAVGN